MVSFPVKIAFPYLLNREIHKIAIFRQYSAHIALLFKSFSAYIHDRSIYWGGQKHFFARKQLRVSQNYSFSGGGTIMAMMTTPAVKTLANGAKYWEHTYDSFFVKTYVPANDLDGQINNYSFRAPLLLVFEEEHMSEEDAVRFAERTGLAKIAASYDTSVLFIYPTCEGGWDKAQQSLYADIISEIKMIVEYEDGFVTNNDFFTRTFKGYFIRGAIFRADIYSYGKSADYVAGNLLTTLNGEYLWGPGEITPAMCSMEGLSVKPVVDRKDIAILSAGNSPEINEAFKDSKHLLIKDKAEYEADFKAFVRKFKMWCGHIEYEPDFEELGMTEDAGCVEVTTSPRNIRYKDQPTHKVGYFAYYNDHIMDTSPAPLVVGFHGGGDSSMYLTYVAGWWEICHRYNFLFVSIENHMDVPASEAIQVIEHLKKRYNIDAKRIYATGFSMGSGKTWDMYQEYPDVFAGLMPASALFPIKDNPFGLSLGDQGLNMNVSVPIFYSGGERSPLVELPKHGESGLDRIKYLAKVNKLEKNFENISFENKDDWENPVYGIYGDEVEKVHDESRGSTLTVNYFKSTDGVVRTALASINDQIHECRHHTCENAWKFVSKFSLDNK